MDAYLQQKLDELKQKNLYRNFKGAGRDGFVNFTSNDYLGLSHDSRVIEAGVAAAEIYGAGAGASRLAGGNYDLYDTLEARLAEHKGYEAAVVFGSGYLANMGVIPALMGEGDVIFADKLSHSCMLESAKLSGAKLVRFKHNDMQDLAKKLQEHRHSRASARESRLDPRTSSEDDAPRKLIITEEIFSMDGDKAPLEEISKLAKQHNCWTLADGAHSLYDGAKPDVDIYVGTLSKSIGCYGGYVCGSKILIEFLKNKAKTLIYSTGLPPFVIGSAIKSLEIIEAEKPYLKTLDNAKILGGNSAIIPIILGSEENALKAAEELKSSKLLVSAIRPPTVPPGTSRLRISVTATHTKTEIDLLKELLKKVA